VNEGERWLQFGQFLRDQRDKVGLNRRQAARRAKVPESLWRDLEAGYTTSYGGVRVLPNPGPDVLEQIAAALEVTTEDLTRHVGRITNRSKPVTEVSRKAGSGLPQKVARLGDRDRRLIESLVDQMLELE
jgi:transcriptional regulator with XRE-family HTH domain